MSKLIFQVGGEMVIPNGIIVLRVCRSFAVRTPAQKGTPLVQSPVKRMDQLQELRL